MGTSYSTNDSWLIQLSIITSIRQNQVFHLPEFIVLSGNFKSKVRLSTWVVSKLLYVLFRHVPFRKHMRLFRHMPQGEPLASVVLNHHSFVFRAKNTDQTSAHICLPHFAASTWASTESSSQDSAWDKPAYISPFRVLSSVEHRGSLRLPPSASTWKVLKCILRFKEVSPTPTVHI